MLLRRLPTSSHVHYMSNYVMAAKKYYINDSKVKVFAEFGDPPQASVHLHRTDCSALELDANLGREYLYLLEPRS